MSATHPAPDPEAEGRDARRERHTQQGRAHQAAHASQHERESHEAIPQAPRRRTRPTLRRRLAAALTTLTATGLLLATWRVLVATLPGQKLDQRALDGSRIGAHYVDAHARALLSTISLPLMVTLAVLILAWALWRGLRSRGVWAGAVLIGATLTTQVLKHWVLSRPDWGYTERWDAANTLPSGHTTVAAAAGVALILVTPGRYRGIAAWASALLAAAMGYSTLVCQWHRPSDVIAGLLVATAWGGAVLACGALDEAAPTGPGLLSLTALGVGAGAIGLLMLGAATWALCSEATSTGNFVAYAAGSALTVAVSCLGMAVLAHLTGSQRR